MAGLSGTGGDTPNEGNKDELVGCNGGVGGGGCVGNRSEERPGATEEAAIAA